MTTNSSCSAKVELTKFMHNYNYVVHFYPWFKFNFPLFWGMVIMYDYEFETKENKICTEDKTKPQQQYCSFIPTLLLRYELLGYVLKLY